MQDMDMDDWEASNYDNDMQVKEWNDNMEQSLSQAEADRQEYNEWLRKQ